MSEENLQNNGNDTGIIPEPPEEFSTTDAMVGVITAPGETFETIAGGPQKNYWLMPTIIFIVINLISTFIIFLDPEIMGSMMDEKMAETREKLEESVRKGEMSREQADEALEMTEKFTDPSSPFFQAIGYGGAIIGAFMVLFLLGLLYFLGLKIFKSEASYSAVLNVIGLAFIISSIQHLLTAVLSILTGEHTNVSLGAILSSETVGTNLNSFLTSIDAFSIWFYAVISTGLMKVGKIDAVKSYGMVFGLWIIWTLLTSFVFTMFG